MGTIRITDGVGTGPMPAAAYDSALAEAGIEDYNLIPLSSVIPAGASLEEVDHIGDLGPVGHIVTVVQASITVDGGERAAAGLAWAQQPDAGVGILYEATAMGTGATDTVEQALTAGLEHGLALRSLEGTTRGERIVSVDAPPDSTACALVVAVYGRASEPW